VSEPTIPRLSCPRLDCPLTEPWPQLSKNKHNGRGVTKKELLEDLTRLLEIMSREDFWLNIGKRKKPNHRIGYIRRKNIMKKHNILSLEELNKPELEEEIAKTYKSVIGGGLTDVNDAREANIRKE